MVPLIQTLSVSRTANAWLSMFGAMGNFGKSPTSVHVTTNRARGHVFEPMRRRGGRRHNAPAPTLRLPQRQIQRHTGKHRAAQPVVLAERTKAPVAAAVADQRVVPHRLRRRHRNADQEHSAQPQ